MVYKNWQWECKTWKITSENIKKYKWNIERILGKTENREKWSIKIDNDNAKHGK